MSGTTFQAFKVPRWPAGIWGEGGYMPAPELLVIIHSLTTKDIQQLVPVQALLVKGISRGVS